MPKQTIIFLGAKRIGYQCLKYLLNNQEALNIDVIGVLTKAHAVLEQADENVSTLAKDNNIEIIDNLNRLPECDWLISVQYHQILKKNHLVKARKAAINLHMAPLPEYRGANQFSFAILDGMNYFGTTIHLMDEDIDHGAKLAERRFRIDPKQIWVEDLYNMTYEHSVQMFEEDIDRILNKPLKTINQKFWNKIPSQIHYKNEMAALKVIDLTWPIEKIEKHVRATFMPGFEPPYALVNDRKIYFGRKKHE
jgi:methionyl-tRNA formyltransferase